MIRVAVVDDEPLARSAVVARLANAQGVLLQAQYADGPSALAGLQAQPVDLVFIDVQMPGMTGLDVLAKLSPARRPLAILLTAHEGFAVRAFALNAVDYLLKPIDDQRFAEALARASDRFRACDASAPPMTAGWQERFAVRIGRRELFVATAQIDWIEADGDYARLHARGREYLLRESLHNLAIRLDPALFVRIHRSAIVRLDRVAELQPLPNRDAMLLLDDGTPQRVSRTYIDALLARLHEGRRGN